MTGMIIAVLIPLIGGLLSGYLGMTKDRKWYDGLNKPIWNPPAWVFGPVWTILYLLMGIASYIIWQNGAVLPLIVYGVQLLVNFAWSPTFFRFQRPDIALGLITVLWFLILWMLILFKNISMMAFWLIIPYFVWVSYATTLNAYIVLKN
jgi:tryptophan-rich sensory protein